MYARCFDVLNALIISVGLSVIDILRLINLNYEAAKGL